MTHQDAVPILARWNRELRYDLDVLQRQNDRLAEHNRRLEQAIRRRALERRHWTLARQQEAR